MIYTKFQTIEDVSFSKKEKILSNLFIHLIVDELQMLCQSIDVNIFEYKTCYTDKYGKSSLFFKEKCVYHIWTTLPHNYHPYIS